MLLRVSACRYEFCPASDAKYRDQSVNMSVCLSGTVFVYLSICLSVCLSQQPHVQISPYFLRMSSVAVARFSTDGNAICYELSVLWTVDDVMFSNNEEISKNQRRRICFVQFARWRHRGRSQPYPTASCCCGE